MKKREFIKLSSVMMAGTVLTPLADFAQDNKITNWAGNLTYGTSSLVRVDTVQEAQEAIRRYSRLKVLGTRHCFNTIADSRDRFLSLAGLNQVINLDTDRHAVSAAEQTEY